jgi:hypothetical protein
MNLYILKFFNTLYILAHLFCSPGFKTLRLMRSRTQLFHFVVKLFYKSQGFTLKLASMIFIIRVKAQPVFNLFRKIFNPLFKKIKKIFIHNYDLKLKLHNQKAEIENAKMLKKLEHLLILPDKTTAQKFINEQLEPKETK